MDMFKLKTFNFHADMLLSDFLSHGFTRMAYIFFFIEIFFSYVFNPVFVQYEQHTT